MIAANHQAIGVGTRVLRSRWVAVTTFCTLSFALFLAFSAGCGPSERQRVQTVSDQFLDAMSQEDWNRAKPLLTEKARDAMGGVDPFSDSSGTDSEKQASSSPRTETYTVGEPSIEDTLASVPVTLVRGDRTNLGMLRLRREDGEWRVRALRIEGEGDRPGVTLDFEEPGAALLGAAFRAVGEGIGEMLKGIGQGMEAFMEGIGKGAAAMEKAQSSHSPEATESPAPSPDPGRDGSVKIEEPSSGS
jgi:hypothetical protein